MSDELRMNYTPGRTVTARIVDETGKFWHVLNEAFEAHSTYTDYDISIDDKGGGAYRGDFPEDIDEGVYSVLFFDSTAPTAPVGQLTPLIWSGSAEVSIASAVLTGSIWESPVATSPGGVTQIANEAISLLGRVSHTKTDYIENINDTDDEAAKKMSRTWGMVRDHCIIELAPPEVTFWQAPGAEIDDDDQNTFSNEWDYVFNRPDNCLSFRGCFGKTRDGYGNQLAYQYEESGDQIGCDYDDETIVFKYIKLVTDTTKWSRELKSIMAHYWAYACARPMGATAEARAGLLAEYERAIFVARGNAAKRVYVKDERGRPDAAHLSAVVRETYGRVL